MPDFVPSPPNSPSPTPTSFSLVCNDGVTFPISSKALGHSIILRTMCEHLGVDRGEVAIPLANVDGPTGKLVVEWCEKHKDDPLPGSLDREPGPGPSAPPFDMPLWDRHFLGKHHCSIPQMAKLVKAANYLEIPWLYKFCCKRIFKDYIEDSPLDHLKALLEPREWHEEY
ncbi:hypothetical protein QR680_000323 [Steinernema hermaphroditum]|uniref:Skp1-related protein n=1 Tax=Steinernema hermaphroditum TaxID=289476 RepID=A0AA39LDW6_9BILA|nr:hypothetical protein QR680_000323 [Steinernema hermaphroditum]